MMTFTAKNRRPNRAELKGRRRGRFICSACGQPVNAANVMLDAASGTAICSLCLERALGGLP